MLDLRNFQKNMKYKNTWRGVAGSRTVSKQKYLISQHRRSLRKTSKCYFEVPIHYFREKKGEKDFFGRAATAGYAVVSVRGGRSWGASRVDNDLDLCFLSLQRLVLIDSATLGTDSGAENCDGSDLYFLSIKIIDFKSNFFPIFFGKCTLKVLKWWLNRNVHVRRLGYENCQIQFVVNYVFVNLFSK